MAAEYLPRELSDSEDCGWRKASYKQLYRFAADACSGDLWVEFGVGVGSSALRLLDLLGQSGKMLLFDSWLGIPTDWNLGKAQGAVQFCPKGTFRFEKPKIEDDRVSFIDGWFRDTLPYKFGQQIALMHLDCDVYESARDVLMGCNGHIGKGTVIIFDELHGYEHYRDHEYRALNEWREHTGHDIKWLGRDVFAAAGVVV